jgi:hypothetical protein
MIVQWNDPDDGACSRKGVVAKCTTPNEEEILVVRLTDGWACECLRQELEILEHVPSVFVATLETRNFSFMALGRSTDDARDSLMRGWQKHCEEYPDADPDSVIPEDCSVTELSDGQCTRDGTIIVY